MAKRACFQPAWTETVSAWLESGHECIAWCHGDTGRIGCGLHRPVDLPRVIAAKGADYSLWNRRSRCPDCGGWVRFHYGGRGVIRPAWDS